MFISGLGTAVPAQRYSKAECWSAFQASDWFARLGPRAHLVTNAVLTRDNGIEARYLALESLDEVFQIDPDTLHKRFMENAPLLARNAAVKALDQARLAPRQIDALVVSTCTGYLCPGLSGYVAERLDLRSNVQAFDLVGQGCAAALPNFNLSHALLASGQCRHVLSVCVEVCSAAMYLDDDPGVLISACLFGDGAGAAVLSHVSQEFARRIEWLDNESLLNPAQRNALKFESRQGMLRNVLTRQVPHLAADHAHQILDTVMRRAGRDAADIKAWIVHAGGRDVLLAIEKKFGLDPHDLRYSARILHDYGNLSSAFVYFVLQAALADQAHAGAWWLSSFGAGFSCHGALLAVE
ncbi:type III polyketide synthase [Paralcaligenes ureilyticus]|uniref:Alkylresorcinol/alkylpyrone synthase n=1 Tax=Paralcaligenes ureilyticus TaxID=627131 RepID=A0A4R3MDN6_9BURK|nr:3-oxoacyl-[acyl-carrier-protein] synthase III C-terminal domain-containing protein [Paralcaligenes ureilyticus]TCT10197.1 alkylresorcinol/alkylpyrone synthase [Paralcaligenes ureilyticus]